MNSLFRNNSFVRLPVYDKQRYGALGFNMEFLQNAFDVIFLLVFIWFWQWGPLQVILFYILETVIVSAFASFRFWNSSLYWYQAIRFSLATFKVFCIIFLMTIVGLCGSLEIQAAVYVLKPLLVLPSFSDLLLGDSNFSLGILALVIQQVMEYRKHKPLFTYETLQFTITVLTPLVRVVIQQFSIALAILSVYLFSFSDMKRTTVMMALILGVFKMIIGQWYVLPKEK